MAFKVKTYPIKQIIADLQQPSAYPHPVAAIHVVQTHVSCVFLTGDFAYKVKKAVNFGFLDYTTLERRRHFCEEELRLNRRLCPELYLEVVPLMLREGRLVIGGNGEPVEWAVRMRQMRECEMLSARLEAGTVGRAEIERLAQALADFHAGAGGGVEVQAFGAHTVLAETMATTLGSMDKVTCDFLPSATRRTIRDYLEVFLHREEALLARRVEQGRIRDCHGDLRTQNICLDQRFDRGLQIFDGIEFNQEFRYIDVAADLAYLTMDLDLAGRADLRECLTDTYSRATEDTDLPVMLRFYQVYRACVRGNIALMAAAEHEISEPERERQRQIADTAYDLARCYALRRERPALLITVGFSGSGKSQLARELCRRLPAVHLSSDRLRKEQAGIPATARLEIAHYTEASREAVYQQLFERAAEPLQRGEHVLLDATFLTAKARAEAAELAQRMQAEFWGIACECPEAVIRERLQRRGQDKNASDAGLAVYEGQRSAFEPIQPFAADADPICRLICVRTDQPTAEAARFVTDRFLTPAAHSL